VNRLENFTPCINGIKTNHLKLNLNFKTWRLSLRGHNLLESCSKIQHHFSAESVRAYCPELYSTRDLAENQRQVLLETGLLHCSSTVSTIKCIPQTLATCNSRKKSDTFRNYSEQSKVSANIKNVWICGLTLNASKNPSCALCLCSRWCLDVPRIKLCFIASKTSSVSGHLPSWAALCSFPCFPQAQRCQRLGMLK
jgi:hypothetical protein